MEKKIIRFTASWCGPCQALKMTLEGEDLGLPVEVVDIDVNPELAREYQVRSVPTMVLVESYQPNKRLVGVHSLDAIKKWIAE